MIKNEKDLTPRTKRGNVTKTKLVAAAEKVFSELGYPDASVVKITEAAGVGSGTFYLYFASKLAIFEELVEDLNRRVRHAMISASAHASTRLEAEKEGFRAFFKFTAEHPALYRVIRQAELVAPDSLRMHYTKIVEGYIEGLKSAQLTGEIRDDVDPEVIAWALMGVGELIGMRWVLWEQDPNKSGDFVVPDAVLDHLMQFITSGLQAESREKENHG